MPNWCTNKLTVTGKGAGEFLKACRGKVALYSLTEAEKKFNRTLNSNKERIEEFTFNAVIPVPKDILQAGYNTEGYYWQRDNWGTKWDASDVFIVDSEPNKVEIEFANISDEDIVINNDVMAFSIIYGVEDVANSQIDDGEVVVKPGEKEIIRVKAERGATGMVFNLYGVQHSYIFSKAHLGRIEDVEPLDERGTTDGDLSVRSLLWANGNGKLKYMATEVGLLANKSIGTMQAEDGQLLGVLEVTLANTSDETLTVNKVETGYFDASSDFIFVHEVKDDDFAALGELGLPSSVPPKSIVAGYIPFYLDNINYSYFMGIDTNLGYLNFNSIETFSYWTVK